MTSESESRKRELPQDICRVWYTEVYEIFHERVHQMRITKVSRLTSASTDELRYMERKGFLISKAHRLKRRQVRDYQESEARKARLIAKYVLTARDRIVLLRVTQVFRCGAKIHLRMEGSKGGMHSEDFRLHIS